MKPITSRQALSAGNDVVCNLRILFAAFLLAIGESAVADEIDRVVEFDIRPGTRLEPALAEWSVQADEQSISASTLNLPTDGVQGIHTARQALESLLEDTGLWYEVNGDTVLIRPLREGDPRSEAANSADYLRGAYFFKDGACARHRLESCKPTLFESTGPLPSVTISGRVIRTKSEPDPAIIFDHYITLTRRDFQAGGFQTVGAALHSLPQVFAGGFNVGVISAGGSQNTLSQSGASTVNLRGLGSDSTLVLVNGRRIATSEGSGAVDVTLIPISAVERIEIAPGGASALYGSDAVAGVVNIILRRDFQGLELTSALGTATEGGDLLHHYSLVAGYASDESNVFSAGDCAWQSEIQAQQRSYIPATLEGTTLLPRMQHCSTLINAKQLLPYDLEASALGVYTRRSVYQAQNLSLSPGGLGAVTRSQVEQYVLNATFTKHFLQSWTASLSGGLSADDVNSPEDLTQSGVLYASEGDRFDNRLWSGQLILSGTLADTKAGPIQLAVGVGYNQNEFGFATLYRSEFSIERGRRIRFAFAESTLPLLPSRTGTQDASALSLDVAARTEQYSDVGRTTNPKIALVYKPGSSVKLSASWGTSFRSPSLLQQFGAPQALLEFVPNAASATENSLALLRFGGNAFLGPEKSSDSSLELTFTPQALPGGSLHISYYDILYRKRIQYPTPNTTDPLSDRNVLPFVIRDPSSAEIAQVLTQSQFTDSTGGQAAAQEATLLIDDRNQNMARQRASGFDLLAKYGWGTAIGQWDTSLNVAYLQLQQQITDEGASEVLSGTVFYPPTWRGRLGVSWHYSRYMASLFTNYTSGSRVVGLPEEQKNSEQTSVASWTTFDGQIGMLLYGNPHRGNTRLTLSAQNILDRRPPLISLSQLGPAGVNYDSTNTSPVGRVLTLQLTQAW